MVNRPHARRRRAWLLCTVWLVAIALGSGLIAVYNQRPGIAGQTLSAFPHASRITPAAGGATLVMFGHPRCPCTRASLDELAVLLTRAPGRFSAFLELVQPESESGDWSRQAIWRQASAIPGVHVDLDREGREARRFGARTSGQTFLFDSKGKLLFSGGITGSRGHIGDNPGCSAVLSLLLHERSAFDRSPVFGCALFDDASQAL